MNAYKTMLTVLSALADNDGLTLKKFKSVNYKSGYQVATEGIATAFLSVAARAVVDMGGNAGIWKSNGVYYIDKSHRESTLHKALEIGKECNQQSILRWKDKSLIWLQ